MKRWPRPASEKCMRCLKIVWNVARTKKTARLCLKWPTIYSKGSMKVKRFISSIPSARIAPLHLLNLAIPVKKKKLNSRISEQFPTGKRCLTPRSEERRVGNERGSGCRAREYQQSDL